MTQKNTKFKLTDLRRIVKEELTSLKEQVDHTSIRDVVTKASELLAAVEEFKAEAAAPVINATTPHLDELERVLEDMVSTPGSYVSKPKVEPKIVSLRAVKSEASKRRK